MAAREDITDLIDMVSDAIERAFARGVEVGGNRMRAKIMEAAAGDGLIRHAPDQSPKPKGKRAKKGAIGTLLQQVLSNHPGLKIVDIEAAAGAMDNTIAIKSLGNELRRLEGKKYKRNTKDEWYLI